MRLHVIVVGKLKDPPVQSLCAEYRKRSEPLFPIVLHEVRDLDRACALVDKLGGPVVALDERGQQLDSGGFAAMLVQWRDEGVKDVSCLIGPADGLRPEDREAAERVLSLSKLTLAHRLAVLVLHEQIYRAGTIAAGHPYHR